MFEQGKSDCADFISDDRLELEIGHNIAILEG